jgi:radical S-adenosyl methionine domain-containing protein 2
MPAVLEWVAMKKMTLPPTINLHSLIPCNYNCGFCYAGFASAKRSHIPQSELSEIIRQIGNITRTDGSPARKLTFSGGEPLLSPTALEDIAFARTQGLVTSLVTNGSLLTEDKVQRLASILDWLTISIDSLDVDTNPRIGRAARGVTLNSEKHLFNIRMDRALGICVKLNTLVNQANAAEDFTDFIRSAGCQPRYKTACNPTRLTLIDRFSCPSGERIDCRILDR